jgi:hypothetical protein
MRFRQQIKMRTRFRGYSNRNFEHKHQNKQKCLRNSRTERGHISCLFIPKSRDNGVFWSIHHAWLQGERQIYAASAQVPTASLWPIGANSFLAPTKVSLRVDAARGHLLCVGRCMHLKGCLAAQRDDALRFLRIREP